MIKTLFAAGLIANYFLETKTQCCGIVGSVAKKPVTRNEQKTMDPKEYKYSVQEFLCEGIQLLKNRGYDSAGVFTLSRSQNNEEKSRLIKYADQPSQKKGCISKVVDEVLQYSGIGTSGIAHTRWATCGPKVDTNAHPHFDQTRKIHLVHNGILPNHSYIKNKYLGGVTFTSQTDTQVIVQFLALQRRQGKTMVQALAELKKVAQQKSQWGLVIIDQDYPDIIYTATNGSPLLIGFSKQEDQIFIVSEKIAFEKHVNSYFESNDNEVFQLDVNKISQIKQRVEKRLVHVNNPPVVLKVPPSPHQSFFTYQILQQGTIPFVPDFQRIKVLQFGQYLTLLACGSSFYAAQSSQFFFKKLNCFKKIHILDPIQLDQSDITENQSVVLISQSGQTKDLIQIVSQCDKKQKVKTIGIINVQGSTLARKVDYPIYIKVGRQVCVAATKSFFHQVLNLIQLATFIAEKKNSAPLQLINQIREDLLLIPTLVEGIVKQNQLKCQLLAEKLKNKTSIYLLARRQMMAIARESALKIKQLNYIHAEALGACEMKHGPIALIQSDKKLQSVVFLFILNNDTYTVMNNALDQMHSRNAYVVLITDCIQRIEAEYNKEVEKAQNEKKQKPHKKYHFVLSIPHLKHVSHLLALVPIQLFVAKMSVIKGINPDFPRNLAKTVTV